MVVSGLNDSTPLQLFGLLKLIRVLRLGRIIRYLNLKDDLKMVCAHFSNTLVSQDCQTRLLPCHVPSLPCMRLVLRRQTGPELDATTRLCVSRD